MLGGANYSPLLFSRVAEVKGLRELPGAAKDRLFPIICCRPWPNAKRLETLWVRIEEAFGHRRFGADLDALKYGSSADTEAAREFDALFNPANGFENFYGELADVEQAVPVLRTDADGIPQLEQQLEHVDTLGRGTILRLVRGAVVNPGSAIESISDRLGPNLLIVLDAGWSNDLLSQEAWFSPLIDIVTDYRPETEIVITGSSFPNSFTDIGAKGRMRVHERTVFDALVRRHNAATLIYGDWGSTRGPQEPKPMINVPRIDLAEDRDWLCFRSEDRETEGYEEVAERIIDDPDYVDSNIWANYMVERTAEGEPGGIRSPATAAAVRINYHLFRQAYVGEFDVPGEVDEEYEDI